MSIEEILSSRGIVSTSIKLNGSRFTIKFKTDDQRAMAVRALMQSGYVITAEIIKNDYCEIRGVKHKEKKNFYMRRKN